MSTRLVRPLLLALFSFLSLSASAAEPAFSLRLGPGVHVQSISSGSGMVPYGNGYLVVGDDTPYLFTVDRAFGLRDQTILKPYPMEYRRIDKSRKSASCFLPTSVSSLSARWPRSTSSWPRQAA